MRINQSILAVGLTLWLSLLVPVVVAQGQPQAARKLEPKMTPKATSLEVARVPAVTTPTVSKEFKVLSVDALSGLDSLALVYGDRAGTLYELLLANASRPVNRAKYLAGSAQEKLLYPLLLDYLSQIKGCRTEVQLADGNRMLNNEQRFDRLEKITADCGDKHRSASAAIESYILSSGSESN